MRGAGMKAFRNGSGILAELLMSTGEQLEAQALLPRPLVAVLTAGHLAAVMGTLVREDVVPGLPAILFWWTAQLLFPVLLYLYKQRRLQARELAEAVDCKAGKKPCIADIRLTGPTTSSQPATSGQAAASKLQPGGHLSLTHTPLPKLHSMGVSYHGWEAIKACSGVPFHQLLLQEEEPGVQPRKQLQPDGSPLKYMQSGALSDRGYEAASRSGLLDLDPSAALDQLMTSSYGPESSTARCSMHSEPPPMLMLSDVCQPYRVCSEDCLKPTPADALVVVPASPELMPQMQPGAGAQPLPLAAAAQQEAASKEVPRQTESGCKGTSSTRNFKLMDWVKADPEDDLGGTGARLPAASVRRRSHTSQEAASEQNPGPDMSEEQEDPQLVPRFQPRCSAPQELQVFPLFHGPVTRRAGVEADMQTVSDQLMPHGLTSLPPSCATYGVQ
jgi:hypothetical protein